MELFKNVYTCMCIYVCKTHVHNRKKAFKNNCVGHGYTRYPESAYKKIFTCMQAKFIGSNLHAELKFACRVNLCIRGGATSSFLLKKILHSPFIMKKN